ncbi:group III truncated hemoglobin [Gallibacterium anatis]|uniref:group III truncated hemoglobin n=1 Tax=Gallibacterium anatis TaxID=750 RepID=UPI000BA18D24|nr:group III truncated hemoglobin [Gallibacterium anatis]WAX72140.1 group III truncated hemoglobin [Gallibacterium anatis]
MSKLLEDRNDIELLVNRFYDSLLADDRIGYMFTHLRGKHWQAHLEKMYRFWESNIFDMESYQGNPMLAHIKIHNRQPMSEEMFAIWLSHWQNTVNQLFHGEKAEKALFRAATIKDLMQQRVLTDELPMFMQKIRPTRG